MALANFKTWAAGCILAAALSAQSAQYGPLMLNTDGTIAYPTNFFDVNYGRIMMLEHTVSLYAVSNWNSLSNFTAASTNLLGQLSTNYFFLSTNFTTAATGAVASTARLYTDWQLTNYFTNVTVVFSNVSAQSLIATNNRIRYDILTNGGLYTPTLNTPLLQGGSSAPFQSDLRGMSLYNPNLSNTYSTNISLYGTNTFNGPIVLASAANTNATPGTFTNANASGYLTTNQMKGQFLFWVLSNSIPIPVYVPFF